MAVDDGQFRELFASQYRSLCWLGFLLTGNRVEAEDLAQEALVRTYWRWAVLGKPADPASYARKVLINRRRSLLRRAGREAMHLARARPEQQTPPADEGAMALWTAVLDLPPKQRAVLILRYQQDLPEAEVATLLAMPLGTVKSHAHRALARLRARLEGLDSATASKEER
jgi:RNA polymerase sigma-70 factor (sigma-E family)